MKSTALNMESKSKSSQKQDNNTVKHKSPSKLQRNRRRLEKFLNKERAEFQEEKATQVKEHDLSTTNQIDPTEIYRNLEINLNYQRIEDPKNLTRCLRHAVRHLHRNGNSIRFPCPEAEDRLQIKIAGLSTTPHSLWELIKTTYARREEDISLQCLYEDFVRIHGRNAFDPAKTGPSAFYISHTP